MKFKITRINVGEYIIEYLFRVDEVSNMIRVLDEYIMVVN